MAKLSVGEMFNKLLVDSMPPLHYLLLHYWINIFGDSEFSVRLLSTIFSLATIVICFLISKKLSNDKVALITSLLLAVSVFQIEYAQETRNYSLISFLCASSVYFLIRWEENKDMWNIMFFMLSNIFLLYTHVLGSIWIGSLSIYFIISKYYFKDFSNTKLTQWITVQLIILLCFLPWIKVVLLQSTTWNQNAWMPTMTWKDILGTPVTFSGSYALLTISVLSIANAIINFKENKSAASLITYFLIFPIVLLLILCSIFNSIYLQKYTIGSHSFFLILAAFGIAQFKNAKVGFLVIALYLIFSGIKLFDYYTQSRKEQWREAVQYIEKNSKNEDLVLVDAGYCIKNAYNYYAKNKEMNILPLVDIKEEINENNLHSLEATPKEFWLLLSHSRDPKNIVKNKIKREFKVLEYRKLIGIEIYHLMR